MKRLKPRLASLNPIWSDEPAPDVTWGPGGIDDWGWTAYEPSSGLPYQPLPETPTIPPKEPIPHV
jgi:hypothetical protein